MIERYTRPEMGRIWSEQHKFETWLEVEIAACEAMAEEGLIPAEALRAEDSRKAIPPLYGALLKNEQDVHLFEQLVFLNRGQRQ